MPIYEASGFRWVGAAVMDIFVIFMPQGVNFIFHFIAGSAIRKSPFLRS